MNVWVTKAGREIPFDKIEDDHLINILRMLYRNAMQKIKALEWLDEIQKFPKKVYSWRDHVWDQFPELEAESDKRNLIWFVVEEISIEPDWTKLPIEDRSQLEKQIGGALKCAIDAHGPITTRNFASAAKRIYGTLKDFVKKL